MPIEKLIKDKPTEKPEIAKAKLPFKPVHEKVYNSSEKARQVLELIKSKKKSGDLPKWAKATIDGNKLLFNFSPKKYNDLLV
jgi:hypothetical protein